MKTKLIKIAASAMLISSTTAQADLLTFNGLAASYMPGQDGINFYATWFNDDHVAKVSGYDLHSTGVGIVGGIISNDLLFISMSKAMMSDSFENPWNGTDYLIFVPELVITRSDGNLFNLNSLDLQPFVQGYGATTAEITGYFADGSSIAQTVTLDTTPNQNKMTGNDFINYTLTGFDGIKTLTITQNGRQHLAMDNIDLSPYTAPLPVPEPQTYAMLLAGLWLLGFMVGRRRAVNL